MGVETGLQYYKICHSNLQFEDLFHCLFSKLYPVAQKRILPQRNVIPVWVQNEFNMPTA